MKILITGANGQLGKEFRALENNFSKFKFLFTTKSELEIEDEGMVKKYFSSNRPDVCINCAAYTAVDKAEEEKELAMLINGDAAGILAEISNLYSCRFIHISTDYVFDGQSFVPYKEDDSVNPVNQYGISKLKGEQLISSKNSRAMIFRTSWLYSEFGHNFVKTMIRLMSERNEISVVNDQIGSPTYAADLATAIIKIIEQNNPAKGIFHYCNEGITSWYDFAVEIKNLIGSTCTFKPITSSAFNAKAKRPPYSLLDTTKFRTTFNLSIPNWKESLITCLNHLSEPVK